jgi:hypothetical protein
LSLVHLSFHARSRIEYSPVISASSSPLLFHSIPTRSMPSSRRCVARYGGCVFDITPSPTSPISCSFCPQCSRPREPARHPHRGVGRAWRAARRCFGRASHAACERYKSRLARLAVCSIPTILVTTSSCAPPPSLCPLLALLAPRSASSALRRAGSETRSSRLARRSRLLRATCVSSLCAMYDLLTRARTDDQGRDELHMLGAVRHQARVHRVPAGCVPEQQRARGGDLPQARG